MTTYHCPLCGLRYRWASELDNHARDDHARPKLSQSRDHITRYPAPRVPTDAGVPART